MPKARSVRSFFSQQPKDCQSECCQNSPSQHVTVTSKMQRGKLVLSKQPVDNICRVSTCRLYGKAVRNFAGHLHKEHQLTLKQHKELRPASLHQQYVATKTNKQWMQYRKPEICFVPECAYKQTYLTELNKHLRREHSLSREEYRNMLKTLSLQDFNGHCPAMIEEVEESAMEQSAKLMGKVHPPMQMALDPEDVSYPSVRLLHMSVIPNAVKVLSFNEKDISFESRENVAEGMLTLTGRKRIMSEEHKISFLQSLTSNDPWIYKPSDFCWIKYMCAICKHVHTLDIVFVDAKNVSFTGSEKCL